MLTFASCKHDPLTELVPMDEGGGTGGTDTLTFTDDPCDPDSIYFLNQVLPFLSSSCAQPGCHDPGTAEDGVVLNSWSAIISTADVEAFDPLDSDLYQVLIDNDPDDRMPPSGEAPLSDEEIQMIFDWISQGAQDNSCTACDTSSVTFSSVIQPLIELKCQGCHSGAEPSAGLSLMSYSDIRNTALSGMLMSSIQGTDGYVLMPYNSSPLPDCQIDQIQDWIDAGAPND